MNSSSSATIAPTPANIGLRGWNVYFLAKFGLFWWETIGFHPLENLAFALTLLLPVKSVFWQRVRSVLAWPAAAVLLYYDSWLPPLGRAFSQANLLANFSPVYLTELAGRFVNPEIVALLIVIAAAYLILAHWLRLGVLVMLTLLSFALGVVPSGPTHAPASNAGAGTSPETQLSAFYAREATRTVNFPKSTGKDEPFDLVFLHVCSLAWDDLQAMGLENHPLFARFDILLTRFNSVAAYSGPAAIRLQRAACGQQSHANLYKPAPPACYLMDNLRQAGFEPSLALNHDGHFDDFLRFVQAQEGMAQAVPLALDGVQVTQHSFDGSAIYDDSGVLNRWLETRSKAATPRMALYYNTVSLHDGNRLSGEGADANSMTTFKLRLTRLLDDLDAFLQALEQSGRPAVVALVPEHGAAVRGDRMQIAGLREIPSPSVTLVPVGIKVIGPDVRRSGPAVRVDTPTSFLALSEIMARMVARSPFTAGQFAAIDYAGELPETSFVAENEGAIVMQTEAGFMLKQGTGDWSSYKLSP